MLTLTAAGGSSDTDDQSHPDTQLTEQSDSAWRQLDSDIELGLPSTFSQQTFILAVTLWITFICAFLCSNLYIYFIFVYCYLTFVYPHYMYETLFGIISADNIFTLKELPPSL